MKYYFNRPAEIRGTKDYIILYENIVKDFNTDYISSTVLREFNFFILESCRYYIDGKDYDKDDLASYYELVNSAYYNLLIHKDKIEKSFKQYINNLFSKKDLQKRPPNNLSETVIDLMLSELDMGAILQHVNLGTQEINLQTLRDAVKLEKINNCKKMHDIVLFFIENYNRHEV